MYICICINISVYVCKYVYILPSAHPTPCMGGGSWTSWTFVGISWDASRGLLGTVVRSLGSRVGASVGLLGASWGLLGASWGLLGASWSGRLGLSVRVPPLGRLLGPCLEPLGPSWGALRGLLGNLGTVLEASWAVLERRDDEKARTPKTF